MPFYGNNLNYNRNFKKEFQYDNLKQRSSGLGFFVFAYSLTMTVSAMIVIEVFKAFGSAKIYLFWQLFNTVLTLWIYLFPYLPLLFLHFLYKAFKKQFKWYYQHKICKTKKYDTHSVSRNGGAMIANVATSVIADNFSLSELKTHLRDWQSEIQVFWALFWT